jgi:hypothetical protein
MAAEEATKLLVAACLEVGGAMVRAAPRSEFQAFFEFE